MMMGSSMPAPATAADLGRAGGGSTTVSMTVVPDPHLPQPLEDLGTVPRAVAGLQHQRVVVGG